MVGAVRKTNLADLVYFALTLTRPSLTGVNQRCVSQPPQAQQLSSCRDQARLAFVISSVTANLHVAQDPQKSSSVKF